MKPNRGWLKRQVKAGNVVAVGGYRYDEISGVKQLENDTPVRFGSDFTAGVITLDDHDFQTKSGCCYGNADGTITLIIHGNLNYDLRLNGA